MFTMCYYSMGTVVLELYWKHAPKTCKNFAELARRGYYNNTKFHRIIKDFMVQGGDPTGTGRLRCSTRWLTVSQLLGLHLFLPVITHTSDISAIISKSPRTDTLQNRLTFHKIVKPLM